MAEEPLTWKLDDSTIDTESIFLADGKTLTLYNLLEDITGNYTCWSKNKMVDYTYVLLDISQEINSKYEFSI